MSCHQGNQITNHPYPRRSFLDVNDLVGSLDQILLGKGEKMGTAASAPQTNQPNRNRVQYPRPPPPFERVGKGVGVNGGVPNNSVEIMRDENDQRVRDAYLQKQDAKQGIDCQATYYAMENAVVELSQCERAQSHTLKHILTLLDIIDTAVPPDTRTPEEAARDVYLCDSTFCDVEKLSTFALMGHLHERLLNDTEDKDFALTHRLVTEMKKRFAKAHIAMAKMEEKKDVDSRDQWNIAHVKRRYAPLQHPTRSFADLNKSFRPLGSNRSNSRSNPQVGLLGGPRS